MRWEPGHSRLHTCRRSATNHFVGGRLTLGFATLHPRLKPVIAPRLTLALHLASLARMGSRFSS
jgi:hypothetical protein